MVTLAMLNLICLLYNLQISLQNNCTFSSDENYKSILYLKISIILFLNNFILYIDYPFWILVILRYSNRCSIKLRYKFEILEDYGSNNISKRLMRPEINLLQLFKLFTVGSFCRETRSRSGIERERIDPGCVEDGEAQRSWYKVRTTKKLHCRAKSRSST